MSQAAQLDPNIYPPGTVVQHLTGDVGGIVDPDLGNNIDILGFHNITVTGNPLANNLVISVSGTTENAVQIGNAAGALTSVAVGTLGQILTQGLTTPVWLDGSVVNLGASQFAVQVGTFTGAIASLPVGQTGQTLMGSTGANPFWTSSPNFGGSVTALNDITTTTGDLVATYGNVYAYNNGNAHDASDLFFGKARISGPLSTGDELGAVRFAGYEGSSYITAAKIDAHCSGTIAANRVAGNLSFYTHPDSVIGLPSEPLQRMSINSIGNVTILAPDSGVALTINNGGEVISDGDLTISAGLMSLPTTIATEGQIKINGNRYLHAYGIENTFVGESSGNFTLTGDQNCGFGATSLAALTSGGENSAFGYQGLLGCTTGIGNTALGYKALKRVTTGDANTACGTAGLVFLVSGSYNTSLGQGGTTWNVGDQYTGAESSNIVIQNQGVTGESNKIRIGTQGTGNGEQDACYIAGIYDVTPGVAAGTRVAFVDSVGQLGSSSAGTTGTYLAGNTGGAPTWSVITGGGLVWTQIAGTTQTAASNNGYICQNAAQTTITLPASAAYGSVIEIIGEGAGGWTIVHPIAGHYIQYGNLATTANTGSLTSTNRYDTVRLVCRETDLVWHVTSSTGILSIA